MRLLVAEADASLAEFLQTRLQQEHFAVQLASTGDQISKFGEKSAFDLILLDLNLPGVPGADFLRQLQSRWPEAPVMLLSPASSVEERVKGLDAGADDIIVKPFAWSELAARIRAVLRRRNRPAREVFQFEDLEVNRVSHEVRRAGRAAIIEEVWRIHGDSITNVVDVYINYLRRKIDTGADYPLIRTIRGVGYQIGGNHHPG